MSAIPRGALRGCGNPAQDGALPLRLVRPRLDIVPVTLPVPPPPPSRLPLAWLANQPYLLLTLTPLFWAANAVIGRAAAGHIPPMTLSFIRWTLAFLIILPWGLRHLRADWPAIRSRLGLMILFSATGIGAFNTLQYWALQYTTALNVLLMQSALPLFVALWSLALLGIRLSWGQGLGVAVSLLGVLTILMQGNLAAVTSIAFNKGDGAFLVALLVFGLYSTLQVKRPPMHALSFLLFTFGVGTLCILPFFLWEAATQPRMEITQATLLTIGYVAVFPSILAYLCFNRGVQLIGGNRAAPFFHLIPVFGSALAILFLGERPEWYHAAGYALVLAGIAAAARKPKAISGDAP